MSSEKGSVHELLITEAFVVSSNSLAPYEREKRLRAMAFTETNKNLTSASAIFFSIEEFF